MKTLLLVATIAVVTFNASATTYDCVSKVPERPYHVRFDYLPKKGEVFIENILIRNLQTFSTIIRSETPLFITDTYSHAPNPSRIFMLASKDQSATAKLTFGKFARSFQTAKPKLIFMNLKKKGNELATFLPLSCFKK